MPLAQRTAKPRLFVLTDITSTQAGVREPDDAQSMIRLLHYANEIDIEGLCATSNLGHGQQCRLELIHRIVDAYAADHAGLSRHASFPSAEALRQMIHAGQPIAGTKVPVEQSVGVGKATDASQFLIACGLRDDSRPLWVTVWGGTADLAQALWTLEHEHPREQLDRFMEKLRVHAISDQDTPAAWIRERYPRLFYIHRKVSMRGIYRGGDTSVSNAGWVTKHVNASGTALGKLYPNYSGGDIWSAKIGKVLGVKEGDTPSYLNLIDNGLCDVTDPAWSPTWSGWGGRLKGAGQRWEDDETAGQPQPTDPHPSLASVYQWRPAFQNDFAARVRWAVTPPEQTAYPPTIEIEGGLRREAKVGEQLAFAAKASRDLSWRWWTEHGRGGDLGKGGEPWRITYTPAAAGETHILVAATTRDALPLTRYARIIVKTT